MNTMSTPWTPDLYLLELNWPLNAHWTEKTVKSFKDLADRGARRIVVNMENVPFIDSHGLAALVTGAKFLGDDLRNLRLAAPQAQVKLFLRLTKFDEIFPIYDTLTEAR